MSGAKKDKTASSREERLAAALRENLKRRKAQGRGRQAQATFVPAKPGEASEKRNCTAGSDDKAGYGDC